MIEENGYYKSVIKEALEDLKKTGNAFAFSEEQVEDIKKAYTKELKIKEVDGIFYLTDTDFYDIM